MKRIEITKVAPPAGAWIETIELSPPPLMAHVAPPAGAWIETSVTAQKREPTMSRLPQARGLKLISNWEPITEFLSRLPQARGLKQSHRR